jgi:glycosyltransferase involved in cell wall biosynthesis
MTPEKEMAPPGPPQAVEDRARHLSVIVPVYNEEAVLREFHRRLSEAMGVLPVTWRVVYVNDGSADRSAEVLRSLAGSDARVAIVTLSRNFGKEIAMTAGLDHATGDAVVVIDADLQDPPELIPEMFALWRSSGADVVYGQRRTRMGDTVTKRLTAHVFYRAIQRISRVRIPPDTGDFRLMGRPAVDALRQLREQHRFMKGLFAWIGFEQRALVYDRDARFAGKTKFNYWKLWNFALEGITSFSTVPLKLATYLGLMVSLGAFVHGAFIIYKTLVFGDPVPGYPSLMVVILFLGGTQLACIGILGEYLGRMFDESKGRPLYFVKDVIPARVEPSELGHR